MTGANLVSFCAARKKLIKGLNLSIFAIPLYSNPILSHISDPRIAALTTSLTTVFKAAGRARHISERYSYGVASLTNRRIILLIIFVAKSVSLPSDFWTLVHSPIAVGVIIDLSGYST